MEDDNITFRDKCAILIFQGMFSAEKENRRPPQIVADFYRHFDNKSENERNDCFNSMERLVTMSYKIADIFRKVRLSAFK